MNLRERLEIAKGEGRLIGILLGKGEGDSIIRGRIIEVYEEYCVVQPEGLSYYGFETLVVPFSGVIFAGL